MQPSFFLVVCFQLTFGFEVYDRTRREAGSCVECLTNFNTERSAASSQKERCGALQNYITCRTNTSTLWPGCDVTYEDGNALSSYFYAIEEKNCVVSDTCQCQMNRWFQTNQYLKSSTYMTYMKCLYDATMPACDGFTSPHDLIDVAKRFKDNAFRSKPDCTKDFENSMFYSSSSSHTCGNVKQYLSCLSEVAIGSDVPPLNSTEQGDVKTNLEMDEHCELKMTDTCQCQTAFLVRNHTDICTAASQFVACTENSYMVGCDGEDVISIRSLAQLLKRQHCSNDQAYNCHGAELCYIDMTSINVDTIDFQTSSCKSLESYKACMKTSILESCIAVNKTVKYLDRLMDYPMRCYEVETYTTPSGMYNTDSGMYNTDSGMYNTDSGMFNTQSGMYNTDSGLYNTGSGMYNTQSGMYNTESGMYNTESGMYNTHSGMYSTSPGTLSGDKYVLLMSAVQTARLEAEETLHAAEEAVDAIKTAEKFLQDL